MKRKHILVIEDDHAIRDIIAYVLEAERFDVTTVNKLEPAEDFAAYQPDLILLDEWINARENTLLCHEIKAIHRLAHVPVVIISTSADIAGIALSCNADGYVHKPFDLNELLLEIKRCLCLSRVAAG